MKTLSVVGAIFIHNGCIFAARRGESHYAYVAHRYEFVGGKQEAGESLADALRRELREEMALDAEVVAPYMSVHHDYPDFSIDLHTFLCRMRGDYRLLEHESAAWLPVATLDPAEWAPADAPIVIRIKKEFAL
ncbi:MAG: (deoxy)nucleoside triphosphate pyrophosphohydrolase [Clostridia bacterium]|nr:(deoxy)nucleoside triphosphate pyrophosphohydrolase [Clostridia bacterium]